MRVIDWADVRCLLAVHRAGTLAGAARRLGVNATTVGRRLSALEATLAATLFFRGKDGYELTEAGLRVLGAAERIEQDFVSLERAAAGLDEAPRGNVRLTLMEPIATHLLAPRLPAFKARHPDIVLDLLCTYRTLNLMRGQADLALRAARPRKPSLIGRRVGTMPQALYASPAYLRARAAFGGPLQVLVYSEVPGAIPEVEWLLAHDEVEIALRSTGTSVLLAAARRGLGAAVLPLALGAHDPQLERVPGYGEPPPRQMWIVVHPDLSKVTRIRVVMDWLTEILADWR